MKTRFQELMEDLNDAKANNQDVTFIQIDGWIKAITGKIIHNSINQIKFLKQNKSDKSHF